MSGTALHTVLTQLVAQFKAANVPDLSITDGSDWDPKVLSCQVGWVGEFSAASEAASVRRTQMDSEGSLFSESLLIDCRISYHSGTTTTEGTRKSCSDALNALMAALSYRLPGVWESAYVASYTYISDPVEADITTSVPFTVAVLALV